MQSQDSNCFPLCLTCIVSELELENCKILIVAALLFPTLVEI